MNLPTELFPGPANSKSEKEGWALFGQAKFPNYELFWQEFVGSRTKPSCHIAILKDVPDDERRIIFLNHSIFCSFYRVYARLAKQPPKDMFASRDFAVSLRSLAWSCENIELLFFVLLVVTGSLDEQHPAVLRYTQRMGASKTKAKTAVTVTRGGSLRRDEIPSSPPRVVILPDELEVTRNTLDLPAYSEVANRIRHYKDATEALPTFHARNWLPHQTWHLNSKDHARLNEELRQQTLADEHALRGIVGDYPLQRDLIAQLADNLISEVNQSWGKQLLPIVHKYAATWVA
jgi:hypothetical protein